MTTEEKRFNDPMDKWVSQVLIKQIQNMRDILSILENPAMRTPVADMGLQPETVTEISKNISGDVYVYTLAAKDDFRGFSDTARRDIYSALERNGVPDFELPTLVSRYDQETLILGLWSNFYRMEGVDPLTNTIDEAKSRLEKLYEEREAELERLHIVSITLPESVALLNDAQKIKETAQTVLTKEFTAAIQKLADEIVASDVENLQGATQQRPDWFSRFIMWIRQANDTIETLKPQSNQSLDLRQSTLTLEFAAYANIDDQIRLKMLQPLFAQAAEDLSGLALTELICDRLRSNYVQPDSQTAKEPYKWIDIFEPYTLS